MKSLYEYILGTYLLLPSASPLDKSSLKIVSETDFDKLIDNENECLRLISSVLEFDTLKGAINRNYASHIVLTYLLGVALKDVFAFSESATDFHKMFGSELWLKSAMLHDYGYFRSEIGQTNLRLCELTEGYDLFTDFYVGDMLACLNGMSENSDYECYFSYSYDEIKNYYAFSRSFHESRGKAVKGERADHGIVGAAIAFRKYCAEMAANTEDDIEYNDITLIIQKIACIIAASHNIFKSKNLAEDIVYNKYGLNALTTTTEGRVTRKNELLFRLALADTVECTKLFNKTSGRESYIPPSTVLRLTDIECGEGRVLIDYGRLREYILKEKKSEKAADALDSHIASLLKLSRWTEYNAQTAGTPYAAIITLK